MKKVFSEFAQILLLITLAFSILLVSILFYIRWIWPNAGFEQIAMTIKDLSFDVIKNNITTEDIIIGLLPFIVIYPLCYLYLTTKQQITAVCGTLLFLCWYSGFIEYQIVSRQQSTIYEEEYIYPDKISYEFPENKRNLILIYLESFENNFQSAKHYEKNIIPQLAELQKQGEYSNRHNTLPGTGYSIAALVSSLCATPLRYRPNNDIFSRRHMLPQAICIPEIFKNNGYQTAILKAADITFTDVNVFATSHGFNEALGIDELKTMLPTENITPYLGAFGGLNDKTLFELAKQKIAAFSDEQPFMLTLFTLDTHTPGYFRQPECQQQFGDIRDAYMCTDKTVTDFISWLQQTPLWANTTIVITGDHLLPTRLKAKGHPQRAVYNAFLNLPKDLHINPDKPFATIDLAPTILEAAGIKITPRAFGLGRSLFADTPTLIEKKGLSALSLNLIKQSIIYDKFNEMPTAQVDPYAPYTLGTVLNKEDFLQYASAYEDVLNNHYVDRLSFSLPQRPENDIEIELQFNALINYGYEIKIEANGRRLPSYKPQRNQLPPYKISIKLPPSDFTDNRLQLKFRNTSGYSLAAQIGINPLKMTITEVKKEQD